MKVMKRATVEIFNLKHICAKVDVTLRVKIFLKRYLLTKYDSRETSLILNVFVKCGR